MRFFGPVKLSEHYMIMQIALREYTHFFFIHVFAISFICIKGNMMGFQQVAHYYGTLEQQDRNYMDTNCC